ncbi:MAG: hypothetical protein JWN47_639 [Frankiales bacterium]|nr:hypothetical protein [Frankiales bacterium]
MRIAVFCYPSDPPSWSPQSLSTGIGGSEEAVIHVARLLAARGHEVTVVNALSGPTRRFAGVEWASYEKSRKHAHVGIVWRRPRLLKWVGNSAAGRLYLWLHDLLPEADVLTHLNRFEKVMVLSRFHRNRYPAVPDEKVFITANGIVPEDSVVDIERDPLLMVYGSCYTRGLRTVLNNWRLIRDAVPGVLLDVFYGWQTLQKNNPNRYERLRPVLEPLLRQEGITHLGRIGYAAVAREYARAGLWAYPCSFPETSCISAMKAQVGGAVPVVIPTGALAETVRFGFKTMRSHTDFAGLSLPRRFIREWLDGLISLLHEPARQQAIRSAMIPECRDRFAWARVVHSWESEFDSNLR